MTYWPKIYGSYRIMRTILLRDRRPYGCSLAPTSQCNLACPHCYERFNQTERDAELTVEEFSALVKRLWNMGVRHCTLTDGEPLFDDVSIRKCEIAVKKFHMTWLVTNGTYEFPDLNVLYIISLDGNQPLHDKIRGRGVYDKIRQNIKRSSSDRIVATCTLNTWNHTQIEEIVRSAIDLGMIGIVFNWHTPFTEDDPLWLNYEERNRNIDTILGLSDKHNDFIWNTPEELEILRSSEWTQRCPNWFVISVDASGRRKQPCVFGGAVCEKCGCHVFPSLLATLGRTKQGMLMRLANAYWSRH